MGEWRKGSRNGLKIRWSSDRVGSSPVARTMGCLPKQSNEYKRK